MNWLPEASNPLREEIELLVIRGDRVLLRDRRSADLADYLRWFSSPEWAMWDAPWESEAQSNTDEAELVMRFAPRSTGELSLPRRTMEVDTADGRHIGWVSRYWVDRDTDWPEIGINLPEQQLWGHGLGTEAVALWTEHIFSETNLVRVGLRTWSGNERILRVAEKLGFTVEARFRLARVVEGTRYDAIGCGMLREEWEKLRLGWPGIGPARG